VNDFLTSELSVTALALMFSMGLGLFSYHRHTREHNKLKPRMVPWIMIAMACLATSFMLVVHVVNLLGLETGRR